MNNIDEQKVKTISRYHNKDIASLDVLKYMNMYSLEIADSRGCVHLYLQSAEMLLYAGNDNMELILFSFYTNQDDYIIKVRQTVDDIFIE